MTMDEREGIRLMEYLDGRLTPAERAEVEAWLLRDAEARAAAEEHRQLWSLLGTALPRPEVAPSESFRRDTLARADAEDTAPRRLFARPAALIAAALLVAVIGWAWWSTHPAGLSEADRPVVGHLGLLQHYDFLEVHGPELDVAVRTELMRHLAGELPKDKDGSGR
jgi:anti-sigma factor RsiW